MLDGQMRTAEAAVVAAKPAVQREIEAARAELAQNPIPPSASPLAKAVGVPAWALDLMIAALASVASNGLAMGLLALGGHRPRPSSGAIALAPIEPPARNVVKLAPPATKVGDVDAFMLERVAHERGARVAWADAFLAYRAWCGDYSVVPVDARAFGARLDALRAELGLKAITKGQDVFFVDLALKLAS